MQVYRAYCSCSNNNRKLPYSQDFSKLCTINLTEFYSSCNPEGICVSSLDQTVDLSSCGSVNYYTIKSIDVQLKLYIQS